MQSGLGGLGVDLLTFFPTFFPLFSPIVYLFSFLLYYFFATFLFLLSAQGLFFVKHFMITNSCTCMDAGDIILCIIRVRLTASSGYWLQMCFFVE